MSVTAPTSGDAFNTRFVYERRIGARGQIEAVVPLEVQHFVDHWSRGMGDVAVGYKHVLWDSRASGTLLSGAAEMTFPTGTENEGLGRSLTVFEGFGVVSQRLPHGGFLHSQAGFEVPLNVQTPTNAIYWRTVVGKTFTEARWGRAWSPMVEVLAEREIEFREPATWYAMPETQVTLSRRQHVAINGGARIGLKGPSHFARAVMMSIRWDWSEGGLLSGWTGQ